MATATSTLGLVPRRRLGTLLAERRNLHGYTVRDMARRSMGRFSSQDLESIEAGDVVLDDSAIEALSLIYEFNSTPPSAQRSRLIVADDEDLPVSMGREDFTPELVVSVLQRYVALLYLLRNLPVGAPLPLRADDAKMLAIAFGRPEDQIRAAIERVVAEDGAAVAEHFARMRRRLVVPAAGLLVGPTPAGMLVLVK